jgi:hypothetical protein
VRLVSLVGDGIVVDSADALTLQSATGTSLRSGAALTAVAGGAFSLRGSSAIQIRADTSLTAEAGTALSLRAASSLAAQAGGAVTAQAGGTVDIGGASVRLNGATCGVLRPTDLAAAIPRGRSGLAEPARLADAPLRLLTERRGAARAAPRSLRC